MKYMIADSIKATFMKLDPTRKETTFEIYGYDFMLDEDFKLYLIEINTNPCLELPCPLLSTLIPHMLDNSIRIALDPLFPPPFGYFASKKYPIGELCPENKYELIFDELLEGDHLWELLKETISIQIEREEDEKEDEE